MHSTAFLARTVSLAAMALIAGILHSKPTAAAPLESSPLAKRYAGGWCGVHVTQHQKNEPDNQSPNYALDIRIYDAAGAEIGNVNHANAPGGQGVGVTSQLPYVLILTTENVDNDPVQFAYAGQNWNSNDQSHHCNFGAYDNGARQGDCGFSC